MGASAGYRVAGVLIGVAVLSGCISVGPDYEQVDRDVPDAWSAAIVGDFDPGQPDLGTWWRIFDDPVLEQLIVRAGRGNLDVKMALARIDEARALRGVSASEWYPTVDAGGSVSAFRTSEETVPTLGPGVDREGTLYSVGGSFGWELDLWGRVRRAVESADAGLEASREDYRDVLVVLYAEVALNYVRVRSLQERLRLAQDNLAMQRETHELTVNRTKAGLAPDLDVRQAELNLASTESVIPTLQKALALSIHRIGVLCGSDPGALRELLDTESLIPDVPDEVLVGLPADLLRRRPDIRAEERRLAAQHARIGVAVADLYPTFTLPGSIALEAFDAANLNGGALTYGVGPALRWNLFSGGRIRSMIGAEEARTEQARLRYEKTVLLALEEVENALVSVARDRERVAALDRAVKAAGSSVSLVKSLYRSGLTDFQNLLDMERALTAQQDSLAESRGNVASGVVQLYKALGGGWLPEEAGADGD